MKIKSIELYNIGLYKKKKINFKTDENNVSIIWGNNGAGKTTLLNSIKLVLFGEFAFKYNYEDYCKFVKENMISSRKVSETTNAKISCELLINSDYEEKRYTIERKWKIKTDIFEESVNVYLNDNVLSYDEKVEFLNKVKLSIPPSLLDVIIFDGENAIDILKNDQMHLLIKNIIYAVFGIDVYANLIKDFSIYLKNMSNQDDLDSDIKFSLIEAEKIYKENYTKFTFLNNSLKEYEQKLINISSQLNDCMKKISEKTGVSYDELIDLKNKITNIESDRKTINSEIKYISEEILPLKIIGPKIEKIYNKILEDRPYIVLNNINEIKKYFGNDDEAQLLIEKLLNKINVDDTQKNDTLLLTDKEIQKIEHIYQLLNEFSIDKLKSFFEKKNDTYELFKEKLMQIEKLGESDSIDLINNINDLTDSIKEVKQKIEELNKDISEEKVLLEDSKKTYDKIKKEILDKKKSSNSYLNVLSYKESIENFINIMIDDICEKLNSELLSRLRSISFRNNSIAKIMINKKTFELKLYEKGNKLLSSKLLSAGEKQILLGLLIKSAMHIAQINTFFLFDTPVGRLDVPNRKIFTKEVIFKIADQAIIFATDSDYSKEDYLYLKDSVTQEMKLQRNNEDEIIVVEGSIYGGTK